MKADGADVIKLFATASIRDGGKMTMTVDQINAACGEARKLGPARRGPRARIGRGAGCHRWPAAPPSSTAHSWMTRRSS